MPALRDTQSLVTRARQLGDRAFHDGRVCTPALDPALRPLFAGLKVGEGLPILDAWLAGWTHANLTNDKPSNPTGWKDA